MRASAGPRPCWPNASKVMGSRRWKMWPSSTSGCPPKKNSPKGSVMNKGNKFRKDIANPLLEAAEKDEKILLLVCDMGFGVVEDFAKRYPTRCFNMGMMEQGTVGIAAGMAMVGLKPIVYSIVNFLAFRAIEQIRNDVVMQNLNV